MASAVQALLFSYGLAPGGGDGGVTYATLDGAVTAGTLSNGNLTYTHTSGNGTARSTAQKNSGKWYFEITAGTGIAAGGTNSSVGVMKLGATDINVLNGSDAGMVLKGGNAAIFSNNASSGLSLGVDIADGNIIGVAVDLDNHKIWFRKAPSGNWNGQAIGSQNPATNTGGASLSVWNATTLSPYAGFDAGGSWTANFGASAFTGAVPSGFTSGWTV
ncbi:SPRY domain-containing protein [Bradyrhizobium sp. AZCC 2289]|uniref:SPRY domain-containing protein n=1 Tax=Bradyrhizobium sp. AZCC 2289 TaxID=3117026 RepID=UPI002FEE9CC4